MVLNNLQWLILLYSYDINNNTNTGGTNEFISFYLQSLATRGKRRKSLKPMLTIPCCPPPPRGTSCGALDFNSSLAIKTQKIWSDLKSSTTLFNCRNSTDCPFKMFKFSRPSLPDTMSTTHSIHFNGRPARFPVWGLLWQMMIVISVLRGYKSTYLTMHPN